MSALEDFLRRNSVAPADGLPLVQTVSALRLLEIRDSGVVTAHKCDVFPNEKLNYFFVGRPAYKVESDTDEAAEWELPCCFIFEFSANIPVKRVYPFDTGAHHDRRYPNYIGMMNKDEFEVSGIPDGPQRIIGAFFGTKEAYFRLAAKDRHAFEAEFSLTPSDAHVKAAHRLASQSTPVGFDDRRFTIEVQSESDIDLTVVKPLAVILPTVYLDEISTRDKIENEWDAEPLDYPLCGMSLENYYGIIYYQVYAFYKRKGYL